MSYVQLPLVQVRKYCQDIFICHGFTQEASNHIVDVVLTADLYGIESHGIQRMIRYHQSIINGHVDPTSDYFIEFETPVSAVIDGNKTMGQTTACLAMELAIKKAKTHFFGAVTVRNCNHFGIAGYYSKMAAEHDLLGFCSTNTEAIAVPTFGKKPMLGTSPLAFCMPADPYDFWFDASTTVVPRGKIEVYNKLGKELMDGWASDELGHMTKNAEEVLDNINSKKNGGIYPIGGFSTDTASHKGYGFGIVAEIFTGIFSGGHTSPHIENGGMGDTSFCFMAIDYGIFGDKVQMRKRMSQLLQELRDSPKADGFSRIYTHGEKEMESQKEKMKTGIPVNDKTIEELKAIGAYVNLSFDDYFSL